MEATYQPLTQQLSNLPIDQWHDRLRKILQHYADIPYRYGDITTSVVISQDQTHYLLIHEGWEQGRRIHGTIVHAEIRNGKIWIHYDGIEDGITDELVAAGVPKEQIVLAFHPIEIRQHTGYGVE
jgi:hypothetical protein